ncbi:MAG: putative oxidoreductase [Labilithrix sp.]|nr:putative oxidoreductase [Labilithrix sp.]
MVTKNSSTKPIGVGIVGASPGHTWATLAHLPALAALPAYAVVAVSTTKQASADETARRFGVPHAFASAAPLIEHPNVDLVVVSVKAPDHAPLVRAAIEAKKHVFCEWPLGVSLSETRELADLAKRAGVKTVVGLQRRFAPRIRHLRQLLADGYIGKLRSVTVHAALPLLGARRPRSVAYSADLANGVNVLHTITAHFLDTVFAAVGEPTSFSAVVARQFDETTLEETGEKLPVTSPDQVLVSGTLRDGAVLSVHVEAGKRNGGGLSWTLTGTEGDMTVGLDFALTAARGDAKAFEPVAVPESLSWVPQGELSDDAHQTAHLYQAFAADEPVPTFDDAVRLHRLVEAFLESSNSGRRIAWEAA